jgi:hypothetical protein
VNLAELCSGLEQRGFDYLTTPQLEGYVNDAYLVDICEAEDWSFLEATASGAAPLTVSDLRSVEYVIDTTQETKLAPLDRRMLTDDFSATITTTGSPSYYYLDSGTTLRVYPVETDSLLVRYFKTPPRLSGSASPLLPDRFHSLIVDAAAARAYENSDDYELAQNALTNFQSRMQAMREALLDPYRDGPSEYVVVTDGF